MVDPCDMGLQVKPSVTGNRIVFAREKPLLRLSLGRRPENPWLRAHYERFFAAGKRPKVALVACMRNCSLPVYGSIEPAAIKQRRVGGDYVPAIAPLAAVLLVLI
jgi:hypothetical protein